MTLAVVRGQIQSEEFGMFTKEVFECLAVHSCFTDDNRVTIDLSDWENTSDEEKEDANATDGAHLILSVSVVDPLTGITGSEGRGEPPRTLRVFPTSWRRYSPFSPPVSIPGPYSMNAPEMDELPEYWYVVSRGTEVGIFTDA